MKLNICALRQNDKKMEIKNKKAKFNYEIIETIEAGIVLTGAEVKAIRKGAVDFTGSHVAILGGEAYVINLHIGTEEDDTRKTRKLLLNKREIVRLKSKKESSNLTFIPTKLYNSRAHIKLEIGLARGKKRRGKKQTLKQRDIKRDLERELKDNV